MVGEMAGKGAYIPTFQTDERVRQHGDRHSQEKKNTDLFDRHPVYPSSQRGEMQK